MMKKEVKTCPDRNRNDPYKDHEKYGTSTIQQIKLGKSHTTSLSTYKPEEFEKQYNSSSQISETKTSYWDTHGWPPSSHNSHGRTGSSTKRSYPSSSGQ